MKRGIISIALVIFLCAFVSAEIRILTEPVETIYNLGEVINMPVTIKTTSDISGNFKINLICNGTEKNLLTWAGIKLESGEEKSIPYSFELIKNTIGESKGNCVIKAILGSDYALSEQFKISDSLKIESTIEKLEFNPEETISITGKVTRENGEKSDGFVNARIVSNDYDIVQEGTVTNGNFELNLVLPPNAKAGNYILRITATEKDSDGIITNNGINEYNVNIKQKPKNIELILEDNLLLPEESVKVKAILHDQTGEPIQSTIFITIKNSADKILEQKEIATGQVLEYKIKRGELPSQWKVFAVSNKLSAEKIFEIEEKESADISIINRTIYVENTGNVLYNKTLLVEIKDEPINLQVTLKVGQSKKYVLNAPDGEYNVRIASHENSEINELVSLTGNAIGVKEVFNYQSLNIYLWIVMISGLLLVSLFKLRNIYNKNFFGKMNGGGNKLKKQKEIPVIGQEQSRKGTTAEISLSIKGEKQDASFVCVKIKNLNEAKSKRGSAYETLNKLKELGEENKATIYENNDYLFFILTPAKTRTFKNEKTALELAEKIQETLLDHNRRFNEKINFGISLDYGTIVGKIEEGVFKFMSMGPLVTSSRKIASLSDEKILLSEKMNELLRLIVKTEKQSKDGIDFYIITKIKKENEEARKFIDKFMTRQKGN